MMASKNQNTQRRKRAEEKKASAPSPPKNYKNKTKNGEKPSKMSRKKLLRIRS
jgi:hypothetical protein